jgi:hypothetical protein
VPGASFVEAKIVPPAMPRRARSPQPALSTPDVQQLISKDRSRDGLRVGAGVTVIPGRRWIRIARDFDPDTLLRVLAALESDTA